MAASKWTPEHDAKLRRLYDAFAGVAIPVDDLAKLLDRSPGAVRYRAHKLGLTEPSRPRQQQVPADHVRACACGTVFTVRGPSDTQKSCSRSCAAKQRTQRRGFGGTATRAKVGRRADLFDMFFRSAWEANYARYLNELVMSGEILMWEYEPVTFPFPVMRGNKSYMPDFRVWYSATDYEWHEVKGWMDSASRIKLRRFQLHFPDESARLRLIDRKRYQELSAQYADSIRHWER